MEPQRERLPIDSRQAAEDAAHSMLQVGLRQLLERRRRAGGHPVEGLQRVALLVHLGLGQAAQEAGLAGALSQEVNGAVAGDGQQPGQEGSAGVVPVQPLDHAQPSVLQDVFRHLRIVHPVP